MRLAGRERRAHKDGPLRTWGPGDASLLEHRLDAGQIAYRHARNQVVERQHGVRLTAAEVGLQFDDGIAGVGFQPQQGIGEQVTQALGEIGALEELAGITILVGALSAHNLPKVGGELCLLVAAGSDIGMRGNDLAPGAQSPCWLALDWCHRGFAHLFPGLLLKADAQQFLLLALNFRSLVGSGDGREQALNTIEGAVGIVGAEGLLMRPFVTHIAQLAHERTLCFAKDVAEHDIPLIPHDEQQYLGVPVFLAVALPRHLVLAQV